MKSIGFYADPAGSGGFLGWVETIDGIYFVGIDGKISKPSM